jgi:hypothetical protein
MARLIGQRFAEKSLEERSMFEASTCIVSNSHYRNTSRLKETTNHISHARAGADGVRVVQVGLSTKWHSTQNTDCQLRAVLTTLDYATGNFEHARKRMETQDAFSYANTKKNRT